MKRRFTWRLSALAASVALLLAGCGAVLTPEELVEPDYSDGPHRVEWPNQLPSSEETDSPVEDKFPSPIMHPGGFEWNGLEIPEWDEESAWVELNGNVPLFSQADMSRTDAFEEYSELDELGRCGVAYANICLELMPTEERGDIGSVRPTGWHTVKYNDLISGNYLYNRCHLIGFQLAGENANPKNLITGTRYLNIDGMLDFENQIDDYVEETSNHVLYRVTPIFLDDDLLAQGVLMEAYSVEDSGAGVEFCVFAYNAQPGIRINYGNGESSRLDGMSEDESLDGVAKDLVLNTNTGKFHLPDCQYAASLDPGNRIQVRETVNRMLDAGYTPCGSCHPDEN